MMKRSFLGLILLALALAPFTANAVSETVLNSDNIIVAPMPSDDGDGPIVIADPQHIAGIQITNVGRRPATLHHMLAEYAGAGAETHELKGLVLRRGESVTLPLSLHYSVVKATVYYYGRTRLAFRFLTLAHMPQTEPIEPQPPTAIDPEPPTP